MSFKSLQEVKEMAARNLHANSNKNKPWAFYLLPSALIAMFVASLFFGNNLGITGNNNVVNTGAGNIISGPVTINQAKALRQWSELSDEEEQQTLQEITVLFPQVSDIGTGVSWKPIVKWLAEVKGIVHPNIRDEFRK